MNDGIHALTSKTNSAAHMQKYFRQALVWGSPRKLRVQLDVKDGMGKVMIPLFSTYSVFVGGLLLEHLYLLFTRVYVTNLLGAFWAINFGFHGCAGLLYSRRLASTHTYAHEHPLIIKLIGAFRDESTSVVIMELVEGGTLQTHAVPAIGHGWTCFRLLCLRRSHTNGRWVETTSTSFQASTSPNLNSEVAWHSGQETFSVSLALNL